MPKRGEYALLVLGHNNTYQRMRCEVCGKPGGVAFARPVEIPYNLRIFWTLDFLCPDHFEEAARKAGKLPAADAASEETSPH